MQTLTMSDTRLQSLPLFLFFNLFLRILACRYSTLASAATVKNRSQTISRSWETLAAISAMMSRASRMAVSGSTELYSSSLGLGRHCFSNRVTE